MTSLAREGTADGLVLTASGAHADCPLAYIHQDQIHPATPEDVVRLGLTRWESQDTLMSRSAITSNLATLSIDECSADVNLGVTFTPAPGGDPGVVYAGLTLERPWILEFSVALDHDFELLLTVLTEHFNVPLDTPLSIQRVVIVDLDGDGRAERLIESAAEIPNADLPGGFVYNLVALERGDGRVELLVGEEKRGITQSLYIEPLQVRAIADIAGDGSLEIIVAAPDYSFGYVAIVFQQQNDGNYRRVASCWSPGC